MTKPRARNLQVLALVGTLMAIASGAVVYSPTLYRMFCSLTGYGGTVRRAAAQPAPTATVGTITVHFDANVAPGLAWDFRPEQQAVTMRFGEPTRISYFARNDSDKTMVARAVFNVTPYKAAPYFFKIQCFCFTNEKLAPGQSAHMPVVLYVDGQLLKDPNTREVRDITLSYTFFPQKGLSDKQVRTARDLKSGSEQTETKLKKSATIGFDNDAPRQ